MAAPIQLVVYRFDSDAGFEGQLVGALERIEAGGALRVLDVLFITTDRESAELFALELDRSGASGRVSQMVGFRLDVAERRRATRRALADNRAAPLIRELGATLRPGEALAAILLEHEWAAALNDAVQRIGGRTISNAYVSQTALADLGPNLLAAVGS